MVFNGKINLESIQTNFNPVIVKTDSLIKLKDIYLNKTQNNALISTIVIDNEHQEFFIEVISGDEKTTIRLYPLTDPKKTDSVRKAMVLVSLIIKKQYPKLPVGKTNLQEYLSSISLPC